MTILRCKFSFYLTENISSKCGDLGLVLIERDNLKKYRLLNKSMRTSFSDRGERFGREILEAVWGMAEKFVIRFKLSQS